MDIDNLIAEIQARRPVWDSGDKNYNNRNLLEKLWLEISAKAEAEVTECKKKWKYLRDRLRLELKKLDVSKPGTESVWCYFDQMLFVKNHMLGYKDTESKEEELLYIKMNTISDDNEPQNSGNEASGTDVEKTFIDPLFEQNRKPLIKRTRKIVSASERLLELKQQQAAIQAKKIRLEESDDLLFFKSLLGFMKDFTPLQRLRVRDKIQKVIINEIVPPNKHAWPTSSFGLESSNSN